MKCEKCKINNATIHLTEIVNGEKTEIYLCKTCAEENNSHIFNFDSGFDNFLQGFLGQVSSSSQNQISGGVCENCKSTLSQIQRTGRLGCGQCYKTFREYLKKPLKEIHGSNTHTGKIPGRMGIDIKNARLIDSLKEQLNRAVLEQNFEKAALIRDQIKGLEQNEGRA